MAEAIAHVKVAADAVAQARLAVPTWRGERASRDGEARRHTPAAGATSVGGEPEDDEAVRRLLRRLHLVSTYAENVRLSFRVHEESGRLMLRVLDAETGEVLKEIPPEEYLDVMGRIGAQVGAVLDRRA